MADLGEVVKGFLSPILENPLYLLLTVGGMALFAILIVVHRIHKIHSQDIYVHQAWGAKWKGR